MEADPAHLCQILDKAFITIQSSGLYSVMLTMLLGAVTGKKPFIKAIERLFRMFGDKEEMTQNIAVRPSTEQDNIQEKSIRKGIERFGDVMVSQIMKARIDVVHIDIHASFTELIKTFRDSGYSRIPVVDGSFDKIVGIMNVKDLLHFFDHNNHEQWEQVMSKEVLYVPETKYINHMLQVFQEEKKHMAIVVDEYGMCTGLITMEDIMEEIFGEISDESDINEEIVYRKIDNNSYLFLGKTMIVDLCKIMDLDHETFDDLRGNAETVAGLILENLERVPAKGESIELACINFTIQAADKRRILKIIVNKLNPES